MKKLKIQDFLEPFTKVLSCLPQNTIGHALSLTKNSHKPVFVFDEKDRFVGLVSPFQVLYKNHSDYHTKVSSRLVIPPHLESKDPLFKAISFMLSSRMYTLPVFNAEEKPIGLISAKHIFKELGVSEKARQVISKYLTVSEPITIEEHALVDRAYHNLREKGVSRLIVINKHGGLVGIVSRSDIQFAFIKPTPRQRYHAQSGGKNDAYDDEEIKRGDSPLGNFFVRQVLSNSDTLDIHSSLNRLLNAEHNSIVIVNQANHPVGFISLRDVLEALEKILSPLTLVPVNISKMQGVHMGEGEKIEAHLSNFAQKLGERVLLKRIEAHFHNIETSTDKPMIHEVSVIAYTKKGKDIIAHTRHKVALTAVQEATKRIQEQLRRNLDN